MYLLQIGEASILTDLPSRYIRFFMYIYAVMNYEDNMSRIGSILL